MKKKYTILFFLTTLLFVSFNIKAQVGIGTVNPNNSAALEIYSPNKGLLLNKVNLTSNTDVTTIPNPAVGLIVYATTTHNAGATNEILADNVYYFSGTRWESMYRNDAFDVDIAKIKIPLIGMYAYRKADQNLSFTGDNAIIYPSDATTDYNINTNIVERVSDSVFKVKVNGVYMIDGFIEITQGSNDMSWGMKFQRSTNGVDWFPVPSRGNFCNHSGDGGNTIPITCTLQDSFVLNANDYIRVIVTKRAGTTTSARLDATTARYSSGFKIICYPI